MKCSRSPPRIPFCHGHAPLCWHAKRGLRYAAPPYLSGQRFPSGRHSLSGILLRQASFPVRHLLCQALIPARHLLCQASFPVRHSSLLGILLCQAFFSVRHPFPSGTPPCQASFPVRHSSLPGILLRQAPYPVRHSSLPKHGPYSPQTRGMAPVRLPLPRHGQPNR